MRSLHQILLELLSHSILAKELASNTYSMHGLVQQSILGKLSPEERSEAYSVALTIVDDTFPAYDETDRLVLTWTGCSENIGHVFRIAELFLVSNHYPIQVHQKLAELLERAAW